MDQQILLEVCIDSVASAEAAQAGGAGRVELCAALVEGGTTPSAGMVRAVCRSVDLPVHVLIRPRGGDFCYAAADDEVMAADIEVAAEAGAAGVVIGALRTDGQVDVDRTAALAGRARPLSTTFHRAIDMAVDAATALEALVELGVDRILTSGQEDTALEGAGQIAALVRQADGRIGVIAAGAITERNAVRIARETGVREVHATLRHSEDGPMEYRNARVGMGGTLRPPEFSRSTASAARVRELLKQLADAG